MPKLLQRRRSRAAAEAKQDAAKTKEEVQQQDGKEPPLKPAVKGKRADAKVAKKPSTKKDAASVPTPSVSDDEPEPDSSAKNNPRQ